MSESWMQAYIMYSDGVIDRDCSSAGIIYGVHYGQVESILDEIVNNFNEWFSDEIGESEGFLAGNGMIEFNIIKIHWDSGQQTFPETGQWDYLPHWDFDIELTKHERWIESGEEAELIQGEPF